MTEDYKPSAGEHPITPPPELRRQWLGNDHFPMVTGTHDLLSITRDRLNSVIDQATQWSADQELEACIELLDINGCPGRWIDMLRAARRPKPPSEAEQALEVFEALIHGDASGLDVGVIRQALKRLQQLEEKIND